MQKIWPGFLQGTENTQRLAQYGLTFDQMDIVNGLVLSDVHRGRVNDWGSDNRLGPYGVFFDLTDASLDVRDAEAINVAENAQVAADNVAINNANVGIAVDEELLNARLFEQKIDAYDDRRAHAALIETDEGLFAANEDGDPIEWYRWQFEAISRSAYPVLYKERTGRDWPTSWAEAVRREKAGELPGFFEAEDGGIGTGNDGVFVSAKTGTLFPPLADERVGDESLASVGNGATPDTDALAPVPPAAYPELTRRATLREVTDHLEAKGALRAGETPTIEQFRLALAELSDRVEVDGLFADASEEWLTQQLGEDVFSGAVTATFSTLNHSDPSISGGASLEEYGTARFGGIYAKAGSWAFAEDLRLDDGQLFAALNADSSVSLGEVVEESSSAAGGLLDPDGEEPEASPGSGIAPTRGSPEERERDMIAEIDAAVAAGASPEEIEAIRRRWHDRIEYEEGLSTFLHSDPRKLDFKKLGEVLVAPRGAFGLDPATLLDFRFTGLAPSPRSSALNQLLHPHAITDAGQGSGELLSEEAQETYRQTADTVTTLLAADRAHYRNRLNDVLEENGAIAQRNEQVAQRTDRLLQLGDLVYALTDATDVELANVLVDGGRHENTPEATAWRERQVAAVNDTLIGEQFTAFADTPLATVSWGDLYELTYGEPFTGAFDRENPRGNPFFVNADSATGLFITEEMAQVAVNELLGLDTVELERLGRFPARGGGATGSVSNELESLLEAESFEELETGRRALIERVAKRSPRGYSDEQIDTFVGDPSAVAEAAGIADGGLRAVTKVTTTPYSKFPARDFNIAEADALNDEVSKLSSEVSRLRIEASLGEPAAVAALEAWRRGKDLPPGNAWYEELRDLDDIAPLTDDKLDLETFSEARKLLGVDPDRLMSVEPLRWLLLSRGIETGEGGASASDETTAEPVETPIEGVDGVALTDELDAEDVPEPDEGEVQRSSVLPWINSGTGIANETHFLARGALQTLHIPSLDTTEPFVGQSPLGVADAIAGQINDATSRRSTEQDTAATLDRNDRARLATDRIDAAGAAGFTLTGMTTENIEFLDAQGAAGEFWSDADAARTKLLVGAGEYDLDAPNPFWGGQKALIDEVLADPTRSEEERAFVGSLTEEQVGLLAGQTYLTRGGDGTIDIVYGDPADGVPHDAEAIAAQASLADDPDAVPVPEVGTRTVVPLSGADLVGLSDDEVRRTAREHYTAATGEVPNAAFEATLDRLLGKRAGIEKVHDVQQLFGAVEREAYGTLGGNPNLYLDEKNIVLKFGATEVLDLADDDPESLAALTEDRNERRARGEDPDPAASLDGSVYPIVTDTAEPDPDEGSQPAPNDVDKLDAWRQLYVAEGFSLATLALSPSAYGAALTANPAIEMFGSSDPLDTEVMTVHFGGDAIGGDASELFQIGELGREEYNDYVELYGDVTAQASGDTRTPNEIEQRATLAERETAMRRIRLVDADGRELFAREARPIDIERALELDEADKREGSTSEVWVVFPDGRKLPFDNALPRELVAGEQGAIPLHGFQNGSTFLYSPALAEGVLAHLDKPGTDAGSPAHTPQVPPAPGTPSLADVDTRGGDVHPLVLEQADREDLDRYLDEQRYQLDRFRNRADVGDGDRLTQGWLFTVSQIRENPELAQAAIAIQRGETPAIDDPRLAPVVDEDGTLNRAALNLPEAQALEIEARVTTPAEAAAANDTLEENGAKVEPLNLFTSPYTSIRFGEPIELSPGGLPDFSPGDWSERAGAFGRFLNPFDAGDAVAAELSIGEGITLPVPGEERRREPTTPSPTFPGGDPRSRRTPINPGINVRGFGEFLNRFQQNNQNEAWLVQRDQRLPRLDLLTEIDGLGEIVNEGYLQELEFGDQRVSLDNLTVARGALETEAANLDRSADLVRGRQETDVRLDTLQRLVVEPERLVNQLQVETADGGELDGAAAREQHERWKNTELIDGLTVHEAVEQVYGDVPEALHGDLPLVTAEGEVLLSENFFVDLRGYLDEFAYGEDAAALEPVAVPDADAVSVQPPPEDVTLQHPHAEQQAVVDAVGFVWDVSKGYTKLVPSDKLINLAVANERIDYVRENPDVAVALQARLRGEETRYESLLDELPSEGRAFVERLVDSTDDPGEIIATPRRDTNFEDLLAGFTNGTGVYAGRYFLDNQTLAINEYNYQSALTLERYDDLFGQQLGDLRLSGETLSLHNGENESVLANNAVGIEAFRQANREARREIDEVRRVLATNATDTAEWRNARALQEANAAAFDAVWDNLDDEAHYERSREVMIALGWIDGVRYTRDHPILDPNAPEGEVRILYPPSYYDDVGAPFPTVPAFDTLGDVEATGIEIPVLDEVVPGTELYEASDIRGNVERFEARFANSPTPPSASVFEVADHQTRRAAIDYFTVFTGEAKVNATAGGDASDTPHERPDTGNPYNALTASELNEQVDALGAFLEGVNVPGQKEVYEMLVERKNGDYAAASEIRNRLLFDPETRNIGIRWSWVADPKAAITDLIAPQGSLKPSYADQDRTFRADP